MTNDDTSDRAVLWRQTVAVLTQAVRLTRTSSDGTTEPDDFADFLATALAAVAANVGRVERVTAGRPGSWEAAHIDGLVTGTVGYDPDDLVPWRTEPVRVPLNVAQLVETYGPDAGVLTLDQAEDAIPWPDDDNLTDDEWEDADTAAQAAQAALRHRYQTAYNHYADRFRDLIDEAARAIPGLTMGWDLNVLRIPVTVDAETNPEQAWAPTQNPDQWDHDPLVWNLWDHARTRLGLPQLQQPEDDPEDH